MHAYECHNNLPLLFLVCDSLKHLYVGEGTVFHQVLHLFPKSNGWQTTPP